MSVTVQNLVYILIKRFSHLVAPSNEVTDCPLLQTQITFLIQRCHALTLQLAPCERDSYKPCCDCISAREIGCLEAPRLNTVSELNLSLQFYVK